MKTLTIILTDGPYISEYAKIACKIADAALKRYQVNISLYLNAVHIELVSEGNRRVLNSWDRPITIPPIIAP